MIEPTATCGRPSIRWTPRAFVGVGDVPLFPPPPASRRHGLRPDAAAGRLRLGSSPADARAPDPPPAPTGIGRPPPPPPSAAKAPSSGGHRGYSPLGRPFYGPASVSRRAAAAATAAALAAATRRAGAPAEAPLPLMTRPTRLRVTGWSPRGAPFYGPRHLPPPARPGAGTPQAPTHVGVNLAARGAGWSPAGAPFFGPGHRGGPARPGAGTPTAAAVVAARAAAAAAGKVPSGGGTTALRRAHGACRRPAAPFLRLPAAAGRRGRARVRPRWGGATGTTSRHGRGG
ncbi:hypothetical protein BU14_0103s0008 [Porphyra umbilicalis]|uniref:Uncharacterized protein n=1 Tax=Porphyra umbilicalis TaxID=2786 RepID=A0A1X6PCV3_PORUM|nr:hypothetical protein BU14_0103s0008 [Porphyra umbilicalis]|eukprot:OSX78664.1 hypothetical protein BU14_0103s0008 [Porphyra umbilicalis]